MSTQDTCFERKSATLLPPCTLFEQPRARSPRRASDFLQWLILLSLAVDLVAIFGGLKLAYWLRFHAFLREVGRWEPGAPFGSYGQHFVFLGATLFFLLFHFGMYGPARPLRLRRVIAVLLTSCFIWVAGQLLFATEMALQPGLSRVFLVTSFFTTSAALILGHWGIELLLSLRPIQELFQRRILFVGWSAQSAMLVQNIVADAKHPYRIVGCIPSGQGRFEIEPPEWIGNLGGNTNTEEILAEQLVDILIVAESNPTRGELIELVSICEKEHVHLQVIPSCFEVLLSGLHLETTSGVPVLGITRLPLDSPWNRFLKRALDIIGATVGLILSAPLVAIFGALVYFESPGPIFYRQRRVGCNGAPFFIVKIRSMRQDAEGDGLPGWTKKDDPRRLRIGALIRAWNIDEVP